MRYSDITSGRVDLARLAEMRGGWLGLESEPDPRGTHPTGRDVRLVPAPVTRSDFDPVPSP